MRRPPIATRTLRLGAVLLATTLVSGVAAGSSAAVAPTYHTTYQRGKIVPIGSSIPHADGVMVDRRIVNNLRYLARHDLMVFVIYRVVLGAVVLVLAANGTIS